MLLSQKRFHLIGDIEDLAFVVRFDRKTLHYGDFTRESPANDSRCDSDARRDHADAPPRVRE
jgi:hypothetical protein